MSKTGWTARTIEAEDLVTPRLVAGFRATLTPHLAEIDAATAPLGLHWCLAPDMVEASRLGPDGHPVKGEFLPPVALPRRMWAAGEVRFLAPLAVGDRVRRRSWVSDVADKQGRSGPLCFVTVRHVLETDRGPAIEERQVIVYRGDGGARRDPPAAPGPEPEYRRSVAVDPVLLFRYSALTFNGHRIHYDAPYAMAVEGYAGLVIHGPLQATLLMNFAAIVEGRMPAAFSYRGVSPATGAQTLGLGAEPGPDGALALSVRAADGAVTMTATASW